VVSNVASNQISIADGSPWAWVVWATFLVIAAVTIAAKHIGAAQKDRETDQILLDSVYSPDVTVLDGGRARKKGSAIFGGTVAAIALMIAYNSMSSRVSYSHFGFVAEHHPSAFDLNPVPCTIGLTSSAVACILLVVKRWIGPRLGTLRFSDQGVVFHRGRYRVDVPWSEVSSMWVKRRVLEGDLLVAKPHSTSVLLTTSPAMQLYHRRSKTLRVCDLGIANIASHAVEAALLRHRPAEAQL
jgi:hypothetical protein